MISNISTLSTCLLWCRFPKLCLIQSNLIQSHIPHAHKSQQPTFGGGSTNLFVSRVEMTFAHHSQFLARRRRKPNDRVDDPRLDHGRGAHRWCLHGSRTARVRMHQDSFENGKDARSGVGRSSVGRQILFGRIRVYIKG